MRANFAVKELYCNRITGPGSSKAIGTDFYLDPRDGYGRDANDGLKPTSAVQTLAEGYSRLTDGANDILHIIGNASGLTLPLTTTRLFDWAKSYTHLVGECAPVGVGNRSRIFAITTSVAPTMFRLSGSGCVFRDLSFFYGVASDAALYAFELTGSRNYLENVRIAGIGDDTQDATNAASLYLNGGDENTFINSDIGLTTIGRGTAVNSEIYMAGAALRNVFKKTNIWCRADANTHTFVTKADATGCDWTLFNDCKFINASTNHSIELLSAFTIPANCATSFFFLDECRMYLCADWEVNNRGWVYITSPAGSGDATTSGKAASI